MSPGCLSLQLRTACVSFYGIGCIEQKKYCDSIGIIPIGDGDLTIAIQAKQASQNLLEQLIGKYPLAEDAIRDRFESMLP